MAGEIAGGGAQQIAAAGGGACQRLAGARQVAAVGGDAVRRQAALDFQGLEVAVEDAPPGGTGAEGGG